jgi:arsenate reductase (glutaredoxin)
VNAVIWHNPHCSKSRQTLELIRAQGIEPDIRLYQQDAPGVVELQLVLTLLARPALAITRSKDALFKELGLRKDMDESDLIEALAKNPRLIERPVVLANGKAALGRPPESVLQIL